MRFYPLILFFLLSACRGRPVQQDTAESGYARSFSIQSGDGYKIVTVYDPWQGAENIRYSCVLADSMSEVPDSLRKLSFIKVPVRRVIALSTTHIGFITALGRASSIVGISGENYISDTLVRKAISTNQCIDVGYAPNLDFEKILAAKPDLVFLYALDPSVRGIAKRLDMAGIPSVMVSEYLEEHPLGKAEWIKYFAAFYNQNDSADEIFSRVSNNYIRLCDSVSRIQAKPEVLSGLPWKDTWFLPGGRSFSARFINDAGGDYIWKDNSSKEYIPLDLESVFSRALNADIWINTGTVLTKSELTGHDSRFAMIKAFRTDSVFNNNSRSVINGGNDYWESGVVYPDLILRDLIQIFHPGLLPNHQLYYYKRLK